MAVLHVINMPDFVYSDGRQIYGIKVGIDISPAVAQVILERAELFIEVIRSAYCPKDFLNRNFGHAQKFSIRNIFPLFIGET